MGNAAVAEGLLDVDELDDLYRLDATETEPEPEEEQEEKEEEEKEVKPEGLPH